MKTILVLTDFSKNAAHAARSAARLAEKMHAQLLLWNCNAKIPILPGYMGGTMVVKTIAGSIEDRERLDGEIEELQDYLTATGADYRPRMESGFREGGIKDALTAQLSEKHFELIVMGAASDCSVEDIFIGSDTHIVIENATCPVLIVPPKAHLDELLKIVFATDFDPEELKAIDYLDDLSQEVGFSLEVVHVTVNGEKDPKTSEKESFFTKQLALRKGEILYREIRGKEVAGRLNRISKQTGADILAMTHHQYSFFKRLFSDSTAKKELAHQKIPLLIFPVPSKG